MFNSAEIVRTDKIDLSRPSLEGLVWLLRHPDLWPEGFEWRFMSPFGCAMGLSARQWGRRADLSTIPCISSMISLFPSLTHDSAENLFLNPSKRGMSTTPDDIAKRINAFIKHQNPRAQTRGKRDGMIQSFIWLLKDVFRRQ